MDSLAGQRILVTGANGFVGTHLVRRLVGMGADVYALQRKDQSETTSGPQTVLKVDIRDQNLLTKRVREIQPHIVIHAAACRTEHDWRTLADVNIMALMALLETCAETRVQRLVTLGSSLELLAVPTSTYAASRSASSVMMRFLAQKWELPLIHICTGYVYGPGMSRQKFIPTAIHAGMKGCEIEITPDEIKRNYVYIDDLIDACIAASRLKDPGVHTVNATSPDVHSAREITKAIARVLGKPIATREASHLVRDWDHDEWMIDSSNTRELLGWRAQRSIHAGLTDMINYASDDNGF